MRAEPVSLCFHKTVQVFTFFSTCQQNGNTQKLLHIHVQLAIRTSARARLASYQQINVITRHVVQQEKKTNYVNVTSDLELFGSKH